MKDTESLHKKVQEMCDCYATSDPLREMSVVKDDADAREAALKWLGLAALHGVNNNAEKITVRRSADGQVTVVAKYRESELPSPGSNVGEAIIQAIREITHIEGDKGKTALALGIRDSSVDLKVKVKSKGDEQKVSIKFP
jgi:hypothetical protein